MTDLLISAVHLPRRSVTDTQLQIHLQIHNLPSITVQFAYIQTTEWAKKPDHFTKCITLVT